uniref:Poly [ADP-ribose] polymerase n=1 Tax=Pyxicephalus adspersus TaxID=30357 RepID=A0AAV3A3H0_PYXAD|nr:TPA: hypothetical protein GDO54_015355 [Pyxicephalus adspersus]
MGEIYPYPVSLQWGGDPDTLRRLKNKLLLYFQKRSESNGGECEIRDTDCSRGYILIHYREQEVRDRVLQKSRHVLKLPNREELHLRITLPNAPDPANTAEPASVNPIHPGMFPAIPGDEVTPLTPSSQVLIKNIQDTYKTETLNLLVENISGKAEGEGFYMERIQELKSAVVTFTCDIDIPGFIRTFSSSLRVIHYNLTARPLEECMSVQVENLPEDASEMHLAMFFENSKNGGGKVKEIVMLEEERAALITFHDAADVKRVLKKDHMFSNRNISVYPYYPSLGLVLYGREGPCIEIPKPITFNISQYILQYICNKEGLKNNINVKMMQKHCEIKWPDQDCQNPVLQLVFPSTLSNQLRSAVKIIPTWNEDVYNEFSLFISKFKVTEHIMDWSVWEAITKHVNSPTYTEVLITPDFDSEKVFLAGLVKDVTRIDPIFRKLVEETTKQVERNSKIKTETLSMSPAFYQITRNSGLQGKILDLVPELKIDYDVPTKKIRLCGMREEVLTAKCEILSIKQQMKSKSIQMNPHLVHFLKSTDNEELSCLLFINNKINALLEIEDDAVTLTAFSKEDLINAEEQVEGKLLHKQLLVEDKSLLNTVEWRSLSSYLLQSCNTEKSRVLIQESLVGTEINVIIAGLASEVQKCYQQISDFLEKNSTIQIEIPVQAAAMIRFIWEEKKEILNKVKKNANVTKNQNNICLSGPRLKVREAEKVIKDIVLSLHCDTLRIDKPGAKKFCRDNEEVLITTAKTKFDCVIYLEEVELQGNVSAKPQFQIITPSGLTLSVYKGDLCRQSVDVIVNAANEDLQHIGGLAKAILDAAGHKLQDECNQIIRKEGKLSTGNSVITDAGKLPCKQIIHTVGPRWDENSPSRCERLLRRAITTSLQLASEKCHSSIAIPAVSSGVFGFPLKLCVENIVEAIQDFVEEPRKQNTLQRIHLVDVNDETVNTFTKVIKAKFGNQRSIFPTTLLASQPVKLPAKNPQEQLNQSPGKTVYTKGGLIIKLLEMNIEDCTTDVIVNSVGADLDLNRGAIAKALLAQAGSNIQQLLSDECSGISAISGSVFSTGGCNLNCQEVLDVVSPQWDNGQGASETTLRGIIEECLTQAEKNQHKSISFPAIGTGNLGFPRDIVAFAMFEEVFQFCETNKVQNLKEVHFILHPSDKDTIKFFGLVTNPSLGVHEMKVGSVTYQVKTGDITKEASDIIVNSSNQNFTLFTGVSKAILEAAGPVVKLSAASQGAQPNKGYVITDSGNLSQCKWILHISGPKESASIKTIVKVALRVCEKNQASSIAFPAVGTGAGGLAASVVANSILDGLVDFIKSKSAGVLQTVTVVLFQQHMLNDFYMSMKRLEGTALPQDKSIITRITEWLMSPKFEKPVQQVQKLSAFQLVDGIEPVIFSLCAEDKGNMERTKAWLQKKIEYEQAEKVIREECISELEEAEVQNISDLQKKYQVSVIYKPPDPSMRVMGLTRDVLVVSGEIEMIINRVKDKKSQERAAELTGNLVEWRYVNGGNMVPFDKLTNLKLEEAKIDSKVQMTVQVRAQQYTINFRKEIATDQNGKQIQIQRVVKHDGDSLRLPTHWKDMGKTLMMEVEVVRGTPEYSTVQNKFQQSCRLTILKILRVQNRDLWFNYQIKKNHIDSKNGSTNNEKELFHGTDLSSIQHVNNNGFNRSYAGRNAAAYGNGTYFAVNANYSASSSYAKPDINGQKHMYLARVLTGVFCNGQFGMITPPAKNTGNATDLYDSVTDNVQRPTMFVIFNDIQAYPEYHIIFH